MSAQPIAFKNTGLVTSVGLSAAATCAAIRAKMSNPSETRFIDSDGEWIMAHQVSLEKPWRGSTKLAKMAAMAIEECLDGIPKEEWTSIPMLLCVAERERPGRLQGLDDQLFLDIQEELDARFATESATIAQGRISTAVALVQARKLLYERNVPQVVIAAADSLITWPTLSHYESNDRLLTPHNSNGFMPGEGAGALLLSKPIRQPELVCTGVGFGMEKAYFDSEEPLRAEGLAQAIKAALVEAGCGMHDMDYRITDLSGEQYYFKEAALALGRILRRRKEEFDIWHPAQGIGEVGSVAGVATLAVANAACHKAYALGPNILCHAGNDAGHRAATIIQFRAA
jgi:3-oxoacyl-[acyl-carrier-protein] synthase-1